MPRNLDRRVEAMVRVTDPGCARASSEILDISLADDVLAWTLGPDGTCTKVPTVQGIDAHEVLQELALARANGSRWVAARCLTPPSRHSSRRRAGRSSAR